MPSRMVIFASAIILIALATEAVGERSQLWAWSSWNRMYLGLFGGGALSILLVPTCRFFLKRKSTQVEIRLQHGALVMAGPAVLAAALGGFPSLLRVIGMLSIIGLAGIYLCLNLTVSVAILGFRNEAPSRKRIVGIISFVLTLFAVELMVRSKL